MGQEMIFKDISGAAITRTTIRKLSAIEIPVPSLEVQKRLVEYFNSSHDRLKNTISLQQQKLQSLHALKTSLLDKAFKGEL